MGQSILFSRNQMRSSVNSGQVVFKVSTDRTSIDKLSRFVFKDRNLVIKSCILGQQDIFKMKMLMRDG